jgi:DNA-binding IclR family transcriptional regulator
MANSSGEWSQVKTTGTAFDIIELLTELGIADLTTLADELNLAKSTVHRHIGTLQRRGYVVREDGEYQVGLRFAKLGNHAQERNEAYVLAKSKVSELAEETGERAQFIVEEDDYAVYAYVDHGKYAVRTAPGPGSRIPIHTAASGKAILAHLPRERVEEIIERRGLSEITEYTITDPEELWAELEETRDRGYAYNKQENIEGLLAIGAPVTRPGGEVLGALSISGPTHRMKGKVDNELAELLLGATNELELNINYA